MFVKRVAPTQASLWVAERIQLQDRALDPELLQKLVGQSKDLDVGLRLGGADDLGVELMEFAESALLRSLVPESRTVRRDLERRVLLPAFAEVRAANPRRNSGRSVIDSPPRSSKLYISFDTTSVVSPIVRANTCVGSIVGTSTRLNPYRRRTRSNAAITAARRSASSPSRLCVPRTG
jgi:hypothetical protein